MRLHEIEHDKSKEVAIKLLTDGEESLGGYFHKMREKHDAGDKTAKEETIRVFEYLKESYPESGPLCEIFIRQADKW